jgi:threonine dehydrogenase-like Zn-dependent dehydrogenase
VKAWEVRAGVLALRQVEPPQPVDGHNVIRVAYAGLCGSDLPKIRRPQDFDLPHLWRPGHEIVGTDPNGHWVAIDPLVPCTRCRPCRQARTHVCPQLRRIGWDLPGGLADLVGAPQSNIYRIADSLDPRHAVLADPAAVAIHGLRCAARPPGRRLAIVGAGPIGLLSAIYAHTQGWEVTVFHRAGRPRPPQLIAEIGAEYRPAAPTAYGTFNSAARSLSSLNHPCGLVLPLSDQPRRLPPRT